MAGQRPSWQQAHHRWLTCPVLTAGCCGRATAKLLLAVGASAVAANAAGRTPLDVAISQSPRPLPLLRLLNEEERWRSYIAQPRFLARLCTDLQLRHQGVRQSLVVAEEGCGISTGESARSQARSGEGGSLRRKSSCGAQHAQQAASASNRVWPGIFRVYQGTPRQQLPLRLRMLAVHLTHSMAFKARCCGEAAARCKLCCTGPSSGLGARLQRIVSSRPRSAAERGGSCRSCTAILGGRAAAMFCSFEAGTCQLCLTEQGLGLPAQVATTAASKRPCKALVFVRVPLTLACPWGAGLHGCT